MNINIINCVYLGCFGQGYKLGGEEAVISVNARSLSVNTTYIFRLWVKKMDRASVYTDQAVTIVPGEPPQVTFIFKILH